MSMTKTCYTPERGDTATKLARVAWLSQQNPHKEFTCLVHHLNEESLLACYHQLDGKKAVGLDGTTKDEYGAQLLNNLRNLVERMRKMAYVPGDIREVRIPKEGKAGAYRPLGISNFEDKLVQMQIARILGSVYEPIFRGCSFGFRPGRSCHDAVQSLQNYLFKERVETVIDMDMANFFGTIDHRTLIDLLQKKIKDPKFMRYIARLLKAGVLSPQGDLRVTEEGVPQGSVCSPILANIYAHYAIDVWMEDEVQPNCKGKVKLFRYADDAVICCERQEDALRILKVLSKRLGKFHLKLNEEKTQVVPFSKAKAAQGVPQGSFDFLGFTFYLGKSRKGWWIPKMKTARKRYTAKLKRVAQWVRQKRHTYQLNPLWKIFVAKLRGHVQYYGVSHNHRYVMNFIYGATRIFFKWINRRSQRRSMTWEKFRAFQKANPLPKAEIKHRLWGENARVMCREPSALIGHAGI